MKYDKAMGNLGYDRIEADFYPTPEWCTKALIRAVEHTDMRFYGDDVVWEPACGEGHISRVLAANVETNIISTDLHYGYNFIKAGHGVGGVDFLETNGVPSVFNQITADAIVTNPPYGDMTDRFVRHILYLMDLHAVDRAYLLLRHEWDCAKKRSEFTSECPRFAGTVTLTSRPRWIEGSTGSPRHNYSWFMWNRHWANDNPIKLYGHKD